MTIDFYKTTSSDNQIQKSITDVISYTGSFKNDLDILYPQIIITCDNLSILNYNYCYVNELNRYYFVQDITILSNNRYLIKCAIDVLKTYSTQLQSCLGRIVECENNYNELNCETDKNDDINIIEYPYNVSQILNSNGSILLISQK